MTWPTITLTTFENLLTKMKPRAKNMAVASVIKTYDGRVPVSKVDYYSALLNKLCEKYLVTYIDNGHIAKNHLNGSSLHLNKSRDKLLGS